MFHHRSFPPLNYLDSNRYSTVSNENSNSVHGAKNNGHFRYQLERNSFRAKSLSKTPKSRYFSPGSCGS